MSAGAFITSFYTATYNTAQVHPIRVQPETTGLTVAVNGADQINLPATLVTTSPISARASGSKRTLGLNAARISFRFISGAPVDYLTGSVISLPILNPAIKQAARGSSGSYLGGVIQVVSVSPETVN